jgi:hypothetical protein
LRAQKSPGLVVMELNDEEKIRCLLICPFPLANFSARATTGRTSKSCTRTTNC